MSGPIHDQHAEAATLGGCMLRTETAIDVSETLRSADFYVPRHEIIYETILRLVRNGNPTDTVAVVDDLVARGMLNQAGGMDYVHSLTSVVPTAAQAPYYAGIVHDKAIRRRVVEAVTATVTDIETAPVNSLIEQARERIDAAAGMQRQQLVYVGDMIDEIVADAERPRRVYPTPWQSLTDTLGGGFRPGALYVLAARPGIGKALATDTPIPTPTGWTTMGALKVGDLVYAGDGSATRVTFKSTVRDDRQSWRLTFSDGSTIVADEDHQWVVQSRASRRKGGTYEVRNTREIVETLRVGEGRANWAVPPQAVIDGRDANLSLDPWALGYWLGNGDRAGARVTSGWHDVEHIRAEFVRRGLYVGEVNKGSNGAAPSYTFSVSPVRKGGAPRPTAAALLREMHVAHNKHIPQAYLRASVAQRRALLQGLMDSDGYVTKSGTAQFTVVDRYLASDVRELVRSLGMVAHWTESPCEGRDPAHSTAYTVTFKAVGQVATLERKQMRVTTVDRLGARRFIVSAEEVASTPTQCITVAHEAHTYLAGWSMVTTHNTAIALQMAATLADVGPVAMSSLEMPKEELVRRIIAQGAQIPHHLLERGQPMPESFKARIEAWQGYAPHAIAIDDRSSVTVADVRAFARAVRQPSGRIAGIVCDYLQLMGGPPGASRIEVVSENARQFKLMARDLDCPVILLSQLNRDSEKRMDKRPQLSDLRDSGAIEQDADVVMMLYRDPDFEAPDPGGPPVPVPLELNTAKNRHGPTLMTNLYWEGSQMRAFDGSDNRRYA